MEKGEVNITKDKESHRLSQDKLQWLGSTQTGHLFSNLFYSSRISKINRAVLTKLCWGRSEVSTSPCVCPIAT